MNDVSPRFLFAAIARCVQPPSWALRGIHCPCAVSAISFPQQMRSCHLIVQCLSTFCTRHAVTHSVWIDFERVVWRVSPGPSFSIVAWVCDSSCFAFIVQYLLCRYAFRQLGSSRCHAQVAYYRNDNRGLGATCAKTCLQCTIDEAKQKQTKSNKQKNIYIYIYIYIFIFI